MFVLHLSRQLDFFIKVIEARFKEAHPLAKIILGVGLLALLIIQGLLHVIVLFFYPSATSFAHLHKMQPAVGYKVSFIEHNNWLRRLKVGSTSALVVVAFLTTIVNILFLTAQPAYAVVRTWDGGGGVDTNWGTCANWSDNTCPTSSDVATFDATSTNNVIIATTLTGSTAPAGIDINTGYTGIITQNVGVSITVGSSGYDQADGTFMGGNSAINVGNIILSGGSFTSTSGTLTVTGNFDNSGGGAFEPNNGIVAFTTGDDTINVNSTETFANLVINASASTKTISDSDTLTVTGILTLTDGSINQTTVPDAGTIVVQGSISHASTFDGGNARVNLEGSATASFSGGYMSGFKLNSASAVATGNTSGTLTFEQAVTIAAGTFNAGDGAVTVGSGVLFTVSGGTFNGGAGTVTMNGGVTISGGAFNGGTLTVFFCNSCTFTLSGGTLAPGSGTLKVGGNWTQTDGVFTEGTSTVWFYRSGSPTIDVNSTETFYKLTFDGLSGWTKTIANNDTLYVSNNLILADLLLSQTTIPAAGTIAASGNVTVESDFDGGTARLTFTGSGTQTFDLTGAEGLFNGDIHVDKSGGEVDLLSDLTMNASGQDLVIREGTFDVSGFALSVTGAGTETLVIESGGNLQLQGGETITGDSASYPQLDSGSKVTYDGTVGPYTLKDYTYSNLKINGSGGTFSPAANEVLGGSLALTAGTLDVNDLTLAINGDTTINGGTMKTGTNTITFGDAAGDSVTISTGKIQIESDTIATDIVKNAATWTNSGGTVVYNSPTGITDNVLAALEPYYNLTVNSSGSTYSLTEDTDVNGTVTLFGGALSTSGSNFGMTVGGGWTDAGDGTFTEGAGTVTFDGTGTISSNEAFENVIIAATTTLGAALDVDGTLTINSGSLDVSGTNYGITVGGGWTDAGAGTFTEGSGTVTFDGTGTINSNEAFENVIIASAVTLGNILDADGTVTINSGSLDVSGTNYGITVGGGWTDAGAGTFTEGSGTVTFDGSGTVNSNEAFEHVTINSAGTLTLGADLDVDGNLTLTAGILDTANTLNYGITVGGNWANTGTFTQRNGKVTFDTVGTTSTISGDTTFYDFTCITPNKPLTFTAGKTQTISGALTLTGTADNLIMLRSTVNGSYWGLTVNGTQSVSYVNVKDSDASGGTAVAQTNSTDAGHNLNWTFNVAPTAPTTLYSNTTADTAQSGLSNPGNLTDSTPNFSAVYTDSDVGDIGNKYCIEVNTASDFGGSNLWFSDSASCATGSSITNITAGNRSSDIEYAGSALSCGVTYYWRIKFWDDSGAAGSYSAAANFQVNCAPTVADDSGAVNEDAVYSGDLSHVDGDGDAVTYSIVSTTSNGVTNLTNTSTGIFTYTPTANFNGSDSFTYRVNDGTVNSNTATFTITVNSVNDVPSFTKGANQTVAEDAGAQTVTSWATGISAGPSNESAQTLTFNVSNDNNSLFSVQPSVSTSTGNLTYSPAANANGSATVTLNISDNGGTANGGVDASANQTFTITVTAVNDAPSFTKGANQTVAEDAGAQTASGWATSISAGPSDESAQTLTFNISNDNNALFSAQPSVSTTTGTLTYTPATNVNGSTTVTLSLSDSGGDTSASQTFTITVTAVNDVPTAQAGFDQTINEDVGSATLSGTASSDVEGSTLTYSWLEVTDSGDGCSLSSTTSSQPTVTLANRDSNYACSFELKVNDGTQDSAADSTVLNVTSNNDQPVLPTLTDQTVNEGETVTVAITATDPDTAVIGFAASDSDNGLDEFFTDNGNNTATFRWTPDFQSAGTYTVAIAATDNNTTVTSALTIDVVNVNRAPTFGGALPNLAVVAGSTTAALFDLDDYFTDLDGDTLTYTVSGNDDATVTLTDGVVTLTVPETTGDSLALTFTATDSNSASAVSNEIIVTITHASIDPEEIDHIGGADTGAGVIIIYDDKGEVLAEWQAFEIGGVIPRLVVINDEAYVFAVKKTSGSTIHAYSSTGEVLRKKRISPKLHWRRIAAGDVYKKNNQEEIVVATKRGSTVYVKVFTFRPNTGVFKIVERSVVFNVFGEFRVSVRNNKIHIKDIDDNQDITVDRWY